MYEVISLFRDNAYEELFPDVNLIYSEDFFVECKMYDVNVEAKSTHVGNLNIFEETVLKLMGNVSYTPEQIQNALCLESDFVLTILQSLTELGLINEQNVLTEKGKSYLNPAQRENTHSEIQLYAIVLPNTKELLCVVDKKDIYRGEFKKGKFDQQTYFIMTVGRDGAGNQKEIKGEYGNIKGNDRAIKIYPYEIQEKISRLNKRNLFREQILLPKNGGMQISVNGAKCYLHVKCALQRGLVDEILISYGDAVTSAGLTRYIADNFKEYLDNLKPRATMGQASAYDTGENNKEVEKNSDGNSEKYPIIAELLKDLKPLPNANTPDEQKMRIEVIQGNILKLYAILEHIFNYYLLRYPLSLEQQRFFSEQSAKMNGKIIMEFATRLGFKVSDKLSILSNFNRQKIKLYKNTRQPDLYVTLPMAIAASIERKLKGFRKAASQNRNLLFMFERLSESKQLRHGSDSEKDEYKDYEKLKRAVDLIRKLLLSESAITKEYEAAAFDLSQDRLNANVAVEKAIGRETFSLMNDALKEDLMKVSPYYKDNEMLTPMEMVNTLYRILENYLRSRAKNMAIFSEDASEVIPKLSDRNLPKSLTTVGEGMINAALADKGASLGAYALTFFYRLPKEKTDKLLKNTDAFEIIGKIVELRGHGNNAQLNLSMEKADGAVLRDEVFKLVKEMKNI